MNNPAPRILVAPLDWGLGHATRCIPIIRQLESARASVLLAADGAGAALLAAEFPHLTILPLHGYRIRYGRNRLSLLGKLLWQIPGILRSIRREHRWLEDAITEHRIDAVLSDNRYGLYSDRIPSVILTHQLLVRTGLGPQADRLLQRLHNRFLHRFSAVWVPDEAGAGSLAGVLSHPRRMPDMPIRYTGILSRFTSSPTISGDTHLLILLSGPEPQRTMLEDLLFAQLAGYPSRVVVVRGLPGTGEPRDAPPGVTVYNHLPASALSSLIRDASIVVARSGYSTVMDLVAMKKKSVLIPTPGQTEQEYLASYLTEKSYALGISQARFSLREALARAASFPYTRPPANQGAGLREAIADLLGLIRRSSRKTNGTS
jgi:UDP:flavonoid glycosyltransferase YjiC (YdhE family)